ncbi:MAG TPA: histidine phosphatase family protein [Ramlibacter sp.]|nr:histidine phosphatase family protein [Ramlibacter sp.]
MRLWLVRHARPLVEDGLCYGALDVAADEAETLAAAQRLAQVLPPSVDVLASPLRRCTQLAQALAGARPDLRARSDPRLAEMDFGGWEGRAWNSLERAELDAWAGDFAHYRAGRTGESAAQFVARVGRLLDESRAAGRDQAWIAHSGVFKAVLLCQDGLGVTSPSQWPRQSLAWGEWHLFHVKA